LGVLVIVGNGVEVMVTIGNVVGIVVMIGNGVTVVVMVGNVGGILGVSVMVGITVGCTCASMLIALPIKVTYVVSPPPTLNRIVSSWLPLPFCKYAV
jgi:hypothetical protein